MATPEDDRIEERNHEKEKEAYKICLEKIEKHGLAMKLVQAEYTFDNNKLLFYFTADGRIDFRELDKRSGQVCSVPESNCVRSVSGMRPRFWAVSVSADDRCAVIHF